MAASSNPPSSRPGASPVPPRTKPNNRVLDGPHGRILCCADIRGQISHLNTLAAETGARAIIHTGDFGFFEHSSPERINDRTLRHLLLYSPLISPEERNRLLAPENSIATIRSSLAASPSCLLSEFPQFLAGTLKLNVPVYTVWGACEDVSVLEKIRASEYDIDNLYIIDEATSRTLDVGGVKFRFLGLGGALVPHRLFDNGDGQATIAGGQGTMWTTALQIGELVDTAQRHYDASETRIFITHASPGREGLLAQLALVLKADLTISAGLHFRYASSYNEFSVHNDADGYKAKLAAGKETFDKVWENVKTQVDAVIDDHQRMLLEKTILVSQRLPTTVSANAEELPWKNCWNWNLCDAAYGHLVLDIRDGRVSAELKSQGFNYAYRRSSQAASTAEPAPPTPSETLPSAQPPTNPPPAPPVASPTHGPGRKPVSPQPPSVRTDPARSPKPSNGLPSPRPNSSQADASPADRWKSKKNGSKDKAELQGEPKDEITGSPSGTRRSSITHSKNGSKTSVHSPGVANQATLDKSSKSGPEADRLSPMLGTDGSTGTRSPRRPPRNPWTLFVNRLPLPITDTEIIEYFGESKGDVTSVKIPRHMGTNQQKPLAFVEFSDEASMRRALSNHAEKIRDHIINVSIAENREDPVTSDGADGGGRGRGFRGRGRGGGFFANRALGQATAAATGQPMTFGRGAGKRASEGVANGTASSEGGRDRASPRPANGDSA